jgi:hypothetical protein
MKFSIFNIFFTALKDSVITWGWLTRYQSTFEEESVLCEYWMASSRNTFSHFGHKSAGQGTLDWWLWLWERTGLGDLTCVEAFPDGWAL